MSGSKRAVKRFYQSVTAAATEDGFEIRLDDKALRTRGRAILLAPSGRLAEAIRDEWDAQAETIDPAATPLTSLLAEAIDADAVSQWADDILAYAQSDLVCYRADAPQVLAERQAAAWDPYLDWLRAEFGAALVATTGVMAVPQADIALESIRRLLDEADGLTLAGLRKATAITGSAVMALALWKDAFPVEDIFVASLIDEHFQIEQWGEDDEAAARRAVMKEELKNVARFLDLLGGGDRD